MKKDAYTTPELVVLGSVKDLTTSTPEPEETRRTPFDGRGAVWRAT